MKHETTILNVQADPCFDGKEKTRIAIVGGGPVAVSLCIQFFNEIKSVPINRNLEIIVIEKNTEVGPGTPYGTRLDSYILNISKETMDPIPDTQGEFTRWLQGVSDCPQNTNYPPRYYLGEYLKYLAAKVQNEGKKYDLSIEYITNQEAIDVQQISDAGVFNVICSNGLSILADYVIFCIGYGSPSEWYKQFYNLKGYYHNPWTQNIPPQIEKQGAVGIIGTRLTAIDVLRSLHESNHQGKIFMLSKSGLLPTVLATDSKVHSLKYLTIEACKKQALNGDLTLSFIGQLLEQELKEAQDPHFSLSKIAKTYKDVSAKQWINKEIIESEAGRKPWQEVLFAFYPLIPVIWPMLSILERDLYFKRFRSLWITYLTAFPLENAYIVRSMIDSRQLKVLGGLNDITHHGTHYLASFYEGDTVKVDYLVNAIGPDSKPEKERVFSAMIDKGLACKTPHATGIQVDADLRIVDFHGNSSKYLFCVGPFTTSSTGIIADLVGSTNQAKVIKNLIFSSLNGSDV